jgi:hypothetical protein
VIFLIQMNTFDIEYDGIVYHFKRNLSESNNVFLRRVWYIVHKKPTNIEQFNKYTELSYIWRNHHIYGVTYPTKIMQLIT